MRQGIILSLLFLTLYFFSSSCNAQTTKGIWYWTWGNPTNIGSINLCIAFSGWVDPDQAMLDSAKVLTNAPGPKFLSLGGGNHNGRWTASAISKTQSYCTQKRFSGYAGIAFDIEEGDSGLTNAFLNCFATCKQNNYQILVTVSHSMPYGIADGQAMMRALIADRNIDYMSPQLYTTGYETLNDFSENGVSWTSYKDFKGKFVPSIVTGSLYNAAATYFAGKGITTTGYIQWAQSFSDPSGSSGSSSGSSSGDSVSTVRCGRDWTDANGKCGKKCTINGDCPSGESCFANVAACSGGTSGSGTTASPIRCGTSWNTANSACGAKCARNADCPAGQQCFADLATAHCAARAISQSSEYYNEQTADGNSGFTPLQIGLVAAICFLVVAVVALIVLVVRNRTKEERV